MENLLKMLELDLKNDLFLLKQKGEYSKELLDSFGKLLNTIDEYKNLEEKEIMNKN